MPNGASIVAVVIVGLLLPLVATACNLIEFERGNASLCDVEGSWLAGWKLLAIVVAAGAIAAGFVELLVFDASCTYALQWEIALSATALCAWADVKEHIIPNKVVLLVAIAAVVVCLVQILVLGTPWNIVAITALGGGLLGGGVFIVSRLVTRGGVGYGDVKLFTSLGLLLGFQVLFNVLLYALLAAFAYGMALLLFRRKKLNDRLPLGPFALIGVLVSIGFGV